MKNNIIELCALLWAMHTPESENNQDLGNDLTELHKLVFGKAQADVVQAKINNILKAYTFLVTPYTACQQALTQQKDNDGLYQALMVDVNVRKRNLPPGRKTPIETYRNKGNELENIAVDIADHLKNCYSPNSEKKSNAREAIESIKAFLFREL